MEAKEGDTSPQQRELQQQVPLLVPSYSSSPEIKEEGEADEESQDDTFALRRVEKFLKLFGFCQYSPLCFTLSWASFVLVGVALPVLVIELSGPGSECSSDCVKYEIKRFDLQVLVSQSLVAAISLLCISRNLRKYGIRRFLFVDRHHGHVLQFRREYVLKINAFFRLLVACFLPCFLLKAAREIARIFFEHDHLWWRSFASAVALLICWTYSTVIFLSGTALFNLVCNLQVIHFENYGKLLERDMDVSVYIEEHIRLSHYLSKISHRFRIFLLLEFLVVTASQFASLLQTTSNHGTINIVNGGDFVVSSIVQLVGIVICLHAATKITHRAQGLAAVACRWHALVTCNSCEPSQLGISRSGGNLDTVYGSGSVPVSFSESDSEAGDYVPVPTNTQLASYMSLYHKRQAFVTYVQSNPGGATIFGWTVDRALISTIFFVEMSLVLFVLGKTISFTTE